MCVTHIELPGPQAKLCCGKVCLRNSPSPRLPPVFQYLSTHHDWPVKKSHCQFANQVEILKIISGLWLSLLGAQSRDVGAASQGY